MKQGNTTANKEYTRCTNQNIKNDIEDALYQNQWMNIVFTLFVEHNYQYEKWQYFQIDIKFFVLEKM